MMRLATPSQCRAMDQRTIEVIGVPGLALMEVAGRGAAQALWAWWEREGIKGRRVVIFCGGGNNGGDGWVMGRHLKAWGCEVVGALLVEESSLKGDALWAFKAAKASGVEVVGVEKALSLLGERNQDACVDAVFGTGLTKPVVGLFALVLEAMARAVECVRVALDVPSGLDAESGQALGGGAVMRADLTVTFGCSKPGLHVLPGREWAGEVQVVDLGFSPDTFAEAGVRGEALGRVDVVPWMKPRRLDSHKGTYGRVLVLGGSPGMLGAAVLSGAAALRVGAGLVTVGTQRSLGVSQVAAEQWELMGASLLPDGALTPTDEVALVRALEGADVVAMGPGMGQHEGNADALRVVMERFGGPLVLDAGALNLLAEQGRTAWLEARTRRGVVTVITPHIGEMARLLGVGNPEVQSRRLAAAKEGAQAWGAVVVLKSGSTVVASPRGPFAVNTTGTPGMATAGTGDVLTGMIAGLIAQGLSAWDAAKVGVCLHGLAGEQAELTHGQRGLTAKTLLAALGPMIAGLEVEAKDAHSPPSPLSLGRARGG